MTQRAVTIVAGIVNAHAQRRLQRYLGLLGKQLEQNSPDGVGAGFRSIPQLHFLSLFVIPGDVGPDGRPREPLLVLEANFDGSRREFLTRLIEHQRPLLDRIYRRCQGYPEPGATRESVRRYLEKFRLRSQLFYVGCPGRTTEQIEEEAGLAARIGECLRAVPPPDGRRLEFLRQVWQGLAPEDRDLVRSVPPRPFWVRYGDAKYRRTLALRLLLAAGLATIGLVLASALGWPLPAALVAPAAVVATSRIVAGNLLFIAALAVLLWFFLLFTEFTARLTWPMRLRIFAGKLAELVRATLGAVPSFLALVGLFALAQWFAWVFGPVADRAIAIAIVLVVAVAVLAALYFMRIAWKELDDRVDAMEWRREHLMQMRQREDHGAQNHFVSMTTIKPGVLRWLTTWVALRLVDLLARVFYNPRGLSNIPSIHFARWLILPRRQLLFVTNYDGSWGGYLGQFVAFAAPGLTAIWGNTGGFPRPFLLVGGGVRDEQRFKSYARESQLETLLWYRRYPEATVSAIERNAAIRVELARFARYFDEASDDHPPEAEVDVFLRRFSAPGRSRASN